MLAITPFLCISISYILENFINYSFKWLFFLDCTGKLGKQGHKRAFQTQIRGKKVVKRNQPMPTRRIVAHFLTRAEPSEYQIAPVGAWPLRLGRHGWSKKKKVLVQPDPLPRVSRTSSCFAPTHSLHATHLPCLFAPIQKWPCVLAV